MPRADDPHFCHTSRVPFNISIRHFSECCCGSRKSPLYGVRHLCFSSQVPQNVAVAAAILKMRKCVILPRPFLSSKSFKNDSNYKHSWSAPFLSWSVIIHFSSKTTVIISILGVPLFCGRRLVLAILHISQEILNFCRVHQFVNFVDMSELLYFQ